MQSTIPRISKLSSVVPGQRSRYRLKSGGWVRFHHKTLAFVRALKLKDYLLKLVSIGEFAMFQKTSTPISMAPTTQKTTTLVLPTLPPFPPNIFPLFTTTAATKASPKMRTSTTQKTTTTSTQAPSTVTVVVKQTFVEKVLPEAFGSTEESKIAVNG